MPGFFLLDENQKNLFMRAELVEGALENRPGLASLPWVDVGTGSGAIAIAVAEALLKHNRVRLLC